MTVFLTMVLSFFGLHVGVASVYGTPGDRWSGGVTASGALLQDHQDGIAHRTLPLGARVTVCRLDRRFRCARAVVRDRGPWGLERIDGLPGWRVAPRRNGIRAPIPGWRYRGVADLSPDVARQLGMVTGLRPVVVF